MLPLTRGNFLLEKEKLGRELISLNCLLALQLWSFPFSEFAVTLGTSLDLSGDAFGSAEIPRGIGGWGGETRVSLWRSPVSIVILHPSATLQSGESLALQ